MSLKKNKQSDEKEHRGAKKCPHCGAPLEESNVKKRKKWYEKTSVTLCVVVVLIVIGFGYIHVITGVVSPYQLPFDVVVKEAFGYGETFVNAEKIKLLPYSVAKKKYPIGCRILQRNNYMDFGEAYEAKMTRRQQDNMEQWLEAFDQSLNQSEAPWQDQLQQRPRPDRTDPEDPNAYNDRGIVAARKGGYETALALFTRAFQRDPGFAEAYFNRGLVSVEIGLLGQGISDFGKVVEIKPGQMEGYRKRGSLYFAMEQYDEAIVDFSKIIELDPASAQAFFRRSLANYAKGQYDRAWEDVHEIHNLGISIPPAYLKVLRLVSAVN